MDRIGRPPACQVPAARVAEPSEPGARLARLGLAFGDRYLPAMIRKRDCRRETRDPASDDYCGVAH